MKETILLCQLLISRDWSLKARYIPGKLNVGSVIQAGSSSAHRVVTVPSGGQGSVSIVGSLTVSSVCHKVQSQVSSVCISSARPVGLGGRHFALDLVGLVGYAYPLHQLLTKFLQKYQVAYRCKIILIAPYWPNQPWFPRLSQLAVREPIQLPHKPSLIRQPLTGIFHSRVEVLNLHTWLLEK